MAENFVVYTSNSDINNLNLKPLISIATLPSHYNWDSEFAHEAAELYRAFLYLVWKYPNERLAPIPEIDKMWHLHILDTKKYQLDCDRVFGQFIHHYPYAGLSSESNSEELAQVHKRTVALAKKEFPHIFGNKK